MEVRGGHLKKGFRGRGARPAPFISKIFWFGYKNLFSRVIKSFCREKNLGGWTAGFTLIELIVVVAISAIVSVGGFLILYKYSASQNLKLATGEITAVLRNTQEMSVTQKNGKQWAVRFSNSTSSGQVFRTWSGLSFASSTADQTYKLRTGVNFGNPAVGKDIDVIFSPITGELSQNQIITLLAGTAGSTVSDIIVNPFGKVTTRKEDGLVGYWHFDEGTSTIAYDNSGYGNNGTLYNTPTWQTSVNCKEGGCMGFNGSNNFVDMGKKDVLYGASSATWSAWIKPTTLPVQWSSIITSWNDPTSHTWVFDTYGTGIALHLKLQGDSDYPPSYIVNSLGLSVGQWQYVVATFDGNASSNHIKFYINGLLVYQTNKTSVGNKIANGLVDNLKIGTDRITTAPFNGQIDNVRIYNRALSATEILQMYNDLR